jgi:light-regulated signal transduction histidine kinase (bacteriophytochrome)
MRSADIKYDLSNCEKEPIHRLGKIQSYGGLIAFSSDWLVLSCSNNIAEFCKKKPKDLLGSQAADLITPEVLSTLISSVSRIKYPDQVERIFGINLFDNGNPFDVSLHFSGQELIVEFEPATKGTEPRLMEQLRQSLRAFNNSDDPIGLCKSAAISVAEMIGYDRVMVYRFHPDDSGEVVAEHRLSEVDSFMGLRYPASDIPRQARALYKRNLTRLVADVEAEAVELSPEGGELDLSLSVLRSVSPVHIEYLINMGVKASYSISIIIDGELWGLIACHNYTPKRVDLSLRTYTELFVESFALELKGRLDKQKLISNDITQRLHTQMMAGLVTSLPLIESLRVHGERLKNLISSDSMVIMVEGQHVVFGDPISQEDIQLLAKSVNKISTSNVTAVDSIANWQLGKELTIAERFAGLLAIPISRRPRDMIIFLRREEKQSVTWAGNPEKPVELGPNGSRLTPRKSFAAWSELREGYSAPWLESDLALAKQIKVILLEVFVRTIDEHNRFAEQSQQQQDLLIHELNHRVRNILGLINSIVGQTATSVESVDEFKSILSGRIQALALAQNKLTEENWSYTSFNAILETEIDAFVSDRSRIKLNGPEVSLSPKAFTVITLVTHELITNAMKHGALATSAGTIELSWNITDGGDLSIEWKETGVTLNEPPTRRGFGTLIIERAIPFDLNGTSRTQFAPHGLIANLTLPSNHLQYEDGGLEKTKSTADLGLSEIAKSNSEAKKLLGSALIVEDNMMIAIDEELALMEYGFNHVEIHSSVAPALQAIEKSNFRFAVLDINLGHESSEPIAEKLQELNIPFIFASGYQEWQELLNARFGKLLLPKPFTRVDLKKVVDAVLGS